MRSTTLSALLLGVLSTAFADLADRHTPLTSIEAGSASTPSENAYSIPTPTSESADQAYRIPDHLQKFIAKLNAEAVPEHFEDLRKRQQGGVGGGVVPPAQVVAQPTQVPTVTAYDVDGVHVVYTQTFAATPDPWEAPKPGTIGLGTLTGQVGVVKTAAAKPNKLKARAFNAGLEGSILGGYFRWRN